MDRNVSYSRRDAAAGKGLVPGEVRCTYDGRPTCTTDDLTAGMDRPNIVNQGRAAPTFAACGGGLSWLRVYLPNVLPILRMGNQPDYRPRHFTARPLVRVVRAHNTRLPSVCMSLSRGSRSPGMMVRDYHTGSRPGGTIRYTSLATVAAAYLGRKVIGQSVYS